MSKIPRNLIVPYRQHTLLECDYIIRQAVNPQGYTYAQLPKEGEAEKWQGWIDACMNEAKKPMSGWETSFILSVGSELHVKGRLTEKQIEVLERIYAEKV